MADYSHVLSDYEVIVNLYFIRLHRLPKTIFSKSVGGDKWPRFIVSVRVGKIVTGWKYYIPIVKQTTIYEEING